MTSCNTPPPFLLPVFGRHGLSRPAAHIDDALPPFLLCDPLPCLTAHINPVSLPNSETFFSSSSFDDTGEASTATAPSFPELKVAVEWSIAALGGAAFPKLNWSAPKDATWISTNSTFRYTYFAVVALLLSFDAIAPNLSHTLPSCRDNKRSSTTTFYLALHKWYPSLHSEMEFRCFARRRRCRLIGISKCEVTGFYLVLLDRRYEIQPLIEAFFTEVLKSRFKEVDLVGDLDGGTEGVRQRDDDAEGEEGEVEYGDVEAGGTEAKMTSPLERPAREWREVARVRTREMNSGYEMAASRH